MKYVSTLQAAEYLNVSRTRLNFFIRKGRLPATKVGNAWLIHKDDLEEFAQLKRSPGWKKGRPRKKE